jgi:hypothetical protein
VCAEAIVPLITKAVSSDGCGSSSPSIMVVRCASERCAEDLIWSLEGFGVSAYLW